MRNFLCLSAVMMLALTHNCNVCSLQIDPNSIAAKDGRIREGDKIIQVCF